MMLLSPRNVALISAGGTPTPPSYSAEATALFARMTVQPDATRKGLIDTCITSLKSAGVWAKLECLYLTASHDAQAARQNWIGNTFNLSTVNSPTFTTDRGYAGDGSTSYLSTSFIPSGSSIYVQDSASLGVYLNAGTNTSASVYAMGINATGGSAIEPWFGTVRAGVNAGVFASSITPATRLGFTAASRTASTTTIAYRDGTASSTDATASTTRASVAIFLCGRNSGGSLNSPLDNRVAAAFMGAGLTTTEMGNLRSALVTFLTAIGAN